MKLRELWTTVVAAALPLFVPAVVTPLTAGEIAASKPYREVEVAYDNTKGGVHLEGTPIVPEGKGLHPAVLLITGMGPQDRDETIGPLKPFAVIADDTAEFFKIEGCMFPEVLKVITDWVSQRACRK